MNTFLPGPNEALSVAHQTIDDRASGAERRSLARAARAEKRAARRRASRLSARPTEHYRLPWWAFRFPHSAPWPPDRGNQFWPSSASS
jgi:hypothetical protein